MLAESVEWIADQLTQNSTWRGLIEIAAAAAIIANPVKAPEIVAAALAAVGAINTIRKGARGIGAPDVSEPSK